MEPQPHGSNASPTDRSDQPVRQAAENPAVVRRRLLAIGSTAAIATVASASSASAASATTPWQCGGNSGITTDGTNFLGPTNSGAHLIIKTTASGTSTPAERARFTASGNLGVGTTSPSARVDARTAGATGISGQTTSTSTSSVGVAGTSAAGNGVQGTSTSGTGVRGVSSSGAGTTGTSTSGSGVAGTSSTGNAVTGTTTNGTGVVGTSTNNIGVQGTGAYAGVVGSGGSYGAICNGTSYGLYAYGGPTGVYASGSTYGIYSSGSSYGVYAYSSAGRGVQAQGVIGVYGVSTDGNSAAVQGDGGQYGVYGINGRTAGVRGDSGYVGVWGQGASYGVYGYATASGGYGVMGQAGTASTWGLYSIGNAGIQGTLSKSAGSFKIDHPLDPDNKFLYHSFVESPDMMNVYNGVVTLDARGEATVRLPDYFEALNRDHRYQLTPIGGAAPNLHVKSEVAGNAFTIAGGTAGLKVSWQVTGVRQDDYAKEHPIVVEEVKAGEVKGKRLFVPKGSAARQWTPLLRSTPMPDVQPAAPNPGPAPAVGLRREEP